ncbi:hypothetical protein ACIGHE_01225 [Staphylococcus pasteuri]
MIRAKRCPYLKREIKLMIKVMMIRVAPGQYHSENLVSLNKLVKNVV